MRRFPAILFRTLSGELLRLLAASTAAIVCVLAFGAAIKPLADGQIGPEDTVRLMVLAIVPMLQFALPFACSFAATMTYHRFASENEANAAMASGLAHRSLLSPALAVGAALAIGLGVLMMSVIPNFLREMENVITRNVTEILIARIERGDSIMVGNFQIYAKSAQNVGPDPILADGTGSGAYERLVLTGVLAVQSDDDGLPESAINAEQVFMWFFDDADETGNAIAVQLVFKKASSFDGTTRMSTSLDRLDSQRIRIPGQFRDDPKFLTYSELQDLKGEPELMNYIESTRRVLAMRLAQRELVGRMDADLRASGRFEFVQDGDRLTVGSRGLEPAEDGWRLLPLRSGEGVSVRVALRDGSVRAYAARSAEIALDNNEGRWRGGDWTNIFTLETRALTLATEDPSDPTASRGDYAFGRLTVDDPPEDRLLASSTADLLAAAAADTLDDELGRRLDNDARLLAKRTKKLSNEILSKEHERFAYATSSFLMVLAGAVVGFKLRDAMPLPVYLWSFFPALVAFLTISTGRQFVEDNGAAALPMLWSGAVFVGAYTLFEFVRLRRH